MIDALEGLQGIKVFVDDILVFGQGATMEDAVRDHDQKIHALFQRLNEQNIKLNPKKVQFK